MQFTIPYNNSDPESFIRVFEPYAEHIHSFYFGFPGLFATHNPYRKGIQSLIEDNANTYRFLQLCKGRFKTVLCINTPVYPLTIDDLYFKILKELTPLSIDYGLSAVNVASPTIADLISKTFPNLEVQTSCNTYSFLPRQYQEWHDRFGVTVFNLPREALRSPQLLKDFKSLGFISKCIVNEGCIYGCPANIEHACSFVMPEFAVHVLCDQPNYRLSDIFRSNFIPPHRLDEFNGLLDIAKIAGRSFSTERILQIFLAYLHRDPDADLRTLLHARSVKLLEENHLSIRASDWPKKTLSCECKECHTCSVCEKAMLKIIKRASIDPATLTHPL